MSCKRAFSSATPDDAYAARFLTRSSSLVPFEVTSILILVAILGAVVLVKHRPD